MAKKKIVFVTYGGGHARMILPVVRELQKNPAVTWSIIALTTAIPFFKSKNIPFYTFSDFITDADNDALSLGEELAKTIHNDSVGIPKEETVAYMGISYHELVADHGEEKAATLLKEGRQHFYPHRMMKRMIKHFNPDCIVTTNSPRAEKAAVHIGKELGVYTLTIVDLLGIRENYTLCADTICVLSEYTKENLTKHGLANSSSNIVVTGNPAFDSTLEYQGNRNIGWLREHFPQVADDSKIILSIEQDWGFFNAEGDLCQRTDHEKIDRLNRLLSVVESHNGWLFIRPHPSQNPALYLTWMNEHKNKNVLLTDGCDLHPLLNTVDVVVADSSTVMVESILIGTPVIQANYQKQDTDLPLGRMGLVWNVDSPECLEDAVLDALTNNKKKCEIARKVDDMFPRHSAAEKIATLII